MRTKLSTPYNDTRAADLSLAYGLRALPALGTHVVRLAGVAVELRVLGASHQVVLTGACGSVSETVACLPERGTTLPEREQGVYGEFLVEFTAHCHRFSDAEFADRVAGIVARYGADEHALVGEFPGSPLAVTAMRAEPLAEFRVGGARWTTWHAYPQAGELVETVSAVIPR